MPIQEIHIIYQGHVQGVGFRFTAQHLARKLGVHGWVKNLVNGDVEVVAQASEEALTQFCEGVHSYFSRYIVGEDLRRQPIARTYQDFEIQF